MYAWHWLAKNWENEVDRRGRGGGLAYIYIHNKVCVSSLTSHFGVCFSKRNTCQGCSKQCFVDRLGQCSIVAPQRESCCSLDLEVVDASFFDGGSFWSFVKDYTIMIMQQRCNKQHYQLAGQYCMKVQTKHQCGVCCTCVYICIHICMHMCILVFTCVCCIHIIQRMGNPSKSKGRNNQNRQTELLDSKRMCSWQNQHFLLEWSCTLLRTWHYPHFDQNGVVSWPCLLFSQPSGSVSSRCIQQLWAATWSYEVISPTNPIHKVNSGSLLQSSSYASDWVLKTCFSCSWNQHFNSRLETGWEVESAILVTAWFCAWILTRSSGLFSGRDVKILKQVRCSEYVGLCPFPYSVIQSQDTRYSNK